jgi:hypothetical protein
MRFLGLRLPIILKKEKQIAREIDSIPMDTLVIRTFFTFAHYPQPYEMVRLT